MGAPRLDTYYSSHEDFGIHRRASWHKSTINILFGEPGICFRETANISCSFVCVVHGFGTHGIDLKNARAVSFAGDGQQVLGFGVVFPIRRSSSQQNMS